MPHQDQRQPERQAARRALLSLVAPTEPTNADVLRAVAMLEAKVDQLLASAAPRKSPLTIDSDEIAKTMAQLKMARPLPKETPP